MSQSLYRMVGVAAVVLGVSLASGAERDYTFYDIFYPANPGDPITEVTDINDSGVVAGYYRVEDGVLHGFTWFNGMMTDLDSTYEDGIFRSGEGISQTGTVLGLGTPDKVLAFEDDVVQVMPTPDECAEQSFPNSINDAGTMIAGQCGDGSSHCTPAVYWVEDGIALGLPLLPGLPDDAQGDARDVNDAGVVIVQIEGEARAYTWIDGVITEIPDLVGGSGIGVARINNHNLIVGEVVGVGAMSYDLNSGEMTVLGSGRGDGVNDRGSAVGRDILEFSDVHAILYEDGDEIDLAPFLSPELADKSRARAINDYGWIVGWANDAAGITHGWLLVPIYDKGDYDGDGDVDHQDFGNFQRCFSAENFPDGSLHVGCSVFDFDDDVELGLDDYAAFQAAFTGPTSLDNNPNGPG